MEFEQLILAALQTKFPGVDAKILGRIAKKHAKTATGTTEADAKTIVDGITFQQVLESHADYRATEAQKTAIANYESKHNLRDGKPIEQAQQQQGAQQQPQQGQQIQTTAQQGGQPRLCARSSSPTRRSALRTVASSASARQSKTRRTKSRLATRKTLHASPLRMTPISTVTLRKSPPISRLLLRRFLAMEQL